MPSPQHPAAADEYPAHEQAVIDAAIAILRHRLAAPSGCANHPNAAKSLALLHLAGREHECFAVMFLDAANRLISFDEMFRGTLMQVSVCPREIAKAALRRNAAAVILVHNHPSGMASPSEADITLTKGIQSALRLIDVQTLDHLIVGANTVESLAAMGRM